MARENLHILGIDWQNDFCIADDGHGNRGSLVVPGADEDGKRFANLLRKLKDGITDIHMTMDSHRRYDIAHPLFWINSDGQHPDPFTVITAEDLTNGTWRPVDPGEQSYVRSYTQKLQDNGRYLLCVWPEHCLIGTWGHNFIPEVYDALYEWEERLGWVDIVTKGSNYKTEHYSAVQADVPDPSDPGTQLNMPLIQILQDADRVLITGQAKSHCVANTVRDIANNFGPDNLKKLVLVTDCMSNVPNTPGGPDFEAMGEQFITDMKAMGLQMALSTDF